MGTSRGQCCNVCVTTRSYNNSNNIWNRNFGTDTIDLFIHSGDVNLIGNDELDFQYLNEIDVINPSGNLENYIIPFKTFITNYSNFGTYNKNGKTIDRDNLLELFSSKSQEYIRSFEFIENSGNLQTPNSNNISNQYSYPLEQYTNSDNTKTARLFADNSGIYIVKPNILYNYYINPSSENYELKTIAFVGTDYNTPSFENNRIYLGGEKYCHGVINFSNRFRFLSGYPIGETREVFDLIFNYEPDYSGISNFSGVVGTLAFNYTDNKNNRDQINFQFKKSSGIQPEAYISLLGTGCNYQQTLVSNITEIYRGTGILIDEQSYDIDNNPLFPDSMIYDSVWLNRHHYSGDFSSAVLCRGSGQMKHAWNIIDYNVDNNIGFIKIGLEKIYDSGSESGCISLRYDDSTFTGFNYPVSGNGIINGYFTYYNPSSLRTNIEQFEINNIFNSGNLYYSLDNIKIKNNEFDFVFNTYDSGVVYRYGQPVGNCSLSDINIENYYKKDDVYFNKVSYSTSYNDDSYDILLYNGSGQKYGMRLSSFFNLHHSGMIQDYILDINYTSFDCSSGCFGQQKCFYVNEAMVKINPRNCSFKNNNLPLINNFTKYRTDNLYKDGVYLTNTIFNSGTFTSTHSLDMVIEYMSDYYVPNVFSSIVGLLDSNEECYETVFPSVTSGLIEIGIGAIFYYTVDRVSLNYTKNTLRAAGTFFDRIGYNCCYSVTYSDNIPNCSPERWIFEYGIPSGTSRCYQGVLPNYFSHNMNYPGTESGRIPYMVINGTAAPLSNLGFQGLNMDIDEDDLYESVQVPQYGQRVNSVGLSHTYVKNYLFGNLEGLSTIMTTPACINYDSGCNHLFSFFFLTLGCTGNLTYKPCIYQSYGIDFNTSGNIHENPGYIYNFIHGLDFSISGNQFYQSSGAYFYVETDNNWSNIQPQSNCSFYESGLNSSNSFDNNLYGFIKDNNFYILSNDLVEKVY